MKKDWALFIFSALLAIGAMIFLRTNQINQSLKRPDTITQASFSLDTAPSESLRGNITSMSGQIVWQSRTATQPAQITQSQTIQQGEQLATGDKSSVTVLFANELNMTLNQNTGVIFAQTLPTNMVIAQDIGSADYQKLGSDPISVRSNQLLITINQGEASVSVDTDLGQISVTAKEGFATLGFNDVNFVSNVVQLNQGQTYLFDENSKTGEIQ